MKKTILISMLILLILVLFLIVSPTITGRITYTNFNSYTTAICNETNYCEDFIIECDGKELTKITPTGLSIQQNEDWIDERVKKELCE